MFRAPYNKFSTPIESDPWISQLRALRSHWYFVIHACVSYDSGASFGGGEGGGGGLGVDFFFK